VSNALDSNNNITEVVIHVGVNDLADGESPSKLCENLQDAVNIMREKLPKATFVISDLVAAEYRKVEHANKEIDKLTAKLHCTHSKHYLRSHMFSDDVHPTSQGMAVLVTDINRTLNPRPDEPQRNKGFRPNDSYRPSYRKMSSFNRRFENNNRPYDSRNDNPYESRDFRFYDYSTRPSMHRPYW
jgi:lysophospholipase L1-like esterase